MIIGIGIDLIELKRIEKHIDDNAFIKRVLTKRERELFDPLSRKRKTEFLAGRFSAKEAYMKARGTGLGKSLSFQDLTIVNDAGGRPVLEDRTSSGSGETIHLSITHTEEHAATVAIIESLSG